MLTMMLMLSAVFCLFIIVRSLVKAVLTDGKEVAPDGLKQAGMQSLLANGYDILNVPCEATYVGYVDTSAIKYSENAHFIARKDGLEYAVFVCTEMPTQVDICYRYFPLYTILGVRGLIFIDLTAEAIHHVDFSLFRSRRYRVRHLFYRSLWFAGGIVFAFAWLHRV